MSIELSTILSSIGISATISATGAWWVARKFVTNQFDRRLEKLKADLAKETEQPNSTGPRDDLLEVHGERPKPTLRHSE